MSSSTPPDPFPSVRYRAHFTTKMLGEQPVYVAERDYEEATYGECLLLARADKVTLGAHDFGMVRVFSEDDLDDA